MKTVLIKNLDVMNERKPCLRPATSLFNYYRDNVDALNRIEAPKDVLAQKLNVSRRTLSNWIHALVNSGVIKYKYSGSARLNPNIYFNGLKKDYDKAVIEFDRFHSDL